MELPLDYVSNTGSSFHVLKIVLFAYLCLFMLIYGDLCLFPKERELLGFLRMLYKNYLWISGFAVVRLSLGCLSQGA